MPKLKNWNESRMWCVVDLLMLRWREEARSSKSRDEFWRTRDERSGVLGKAPLERFIDLQVDTPSRSIPRIEGRKCMLVS